MSEKNRCGCVLCGQMTPESTVRAIFIKDICTRYKTTEFLVQEALDDMGGAGLEATIGNISTAYFKIRDSDRGKRYSALTPGDLLFTRGASRVHYFFSTLEEKEKECKPNE